MKHLIWLSKRSQDYTYTAHLVPQIRGGGGRGEGAPFPLRVSICPKIRWGPDPGNFLYATTYRRPSPPPTPTYHRGSDTPGNILLRAFFDALKTEALRAGHRNNKCLRTVITNWEVTFRDCYFISQWCYLTLG